MAIRLFSETLVRTGLSFDVYRCTSSCVEQEPRKSVKFYPTFCMQFITRIGDKNGQIIDFKDSEISLIASAYNSSAAGRGDSHLVITILSAHCDELHVRSVQPPVFDSTPELETSEETSRTGP